MSMLPIQLGVQMHEALQDQVITTSESTQMMTTVFSSVVGAMVITFGMMMFNKALGSNPGNPEPTGAMTSDIIERARLKEYIYRWFPEPEEEKARRLYPYTKTRHVGPYDVILRQSRTGAYSIRLYEDLPGWKRNLKATLTGLEKEEGERKFEEVCGVIRQVRFEHITALRR